MSGIHNIVEKIIDPIINFGALSCLGIYIPEVATGIGIYGVANATYSLSVEIQKSQFEKSLAAITSELEVVTEDEKMKFFDTYGHKTIKDIGEGVLLLLNKIEMPLAANLIGRAHRLFILGEISKEVFHNYCHVIKNLNQYIYDNLVSVYSDSNKKIFTGGVFSLMESFGLMIEIQEGLYASDSADEKNPQPKSTRYMTTDFGQEFYQKIIEPYF